MHYGHIQNAKTSASQTGFPGINVLDDNLDTRWSNNGVGSWIQLDLGINNKVCDISIAWYKGNERQNNFVISTSNDGVTVLKRIKLQEYWFYTES